MSDFDDEPLAAEPADSAAERPRPAANPAPDDEFYDQDPPRRPARREGGGPSGRRPAPRARRDDDWDDDWDEDDEYWDDRGGRGGGPPGGRRDLTIVVALVAAVLAIALVIVATKDNKNSNSANNTPSGATGPAKSGLLCGNWPAALGGDGKNVSGSAGVYLWSDFHGIHIRSNNTVATTVKVVGNTEFSVTAPGAGVNASATKGTTITFVYPPGSGTSGTDLNVPCATTSLGFEVTQAAKDVAPDAIKVGGSATADTNPAQFTRDAG